MTFVHRDKNDEIVHDYIAMVPKQSGSTSEAYIQISTKIFSYKWVQNLVSSKTVVIVTISIGVKLKYLR